METPIKLALADYAIIATIVATVGGLAATLISYSLKQLGERMCGVEGRVGAVEERVNEVERYKTDKRDWAREELLTRNNVQALHGQMARIEGKLDNAFGVAASINRLAEMLGKRQEATGD